MEVSQLNRGFTMDFMPPAQFDPGRRVKGVAELTVTLWMAHQGYEAMMHSERGDFEAAAQSMDGADVESSELVSGLEVTERFAADRRRLRERSAQEWRGESKLEAIALSRKRSKPDSGQRVRGGNGWMGMRTSCCCLRSG